MIEGLGLMASLLVFISFIFKEEYQIRLINIVGAILFVIYGLLINSLSVWFLNGGLVIVHIYYLYKHYKKGE